MSNQQTGDGLPLPNFGFPPSSQYNMNAGISPPLVPVSGGHAGSAFQPHINGNQMVSPIQQAGSLSQPSSGSSFSVLSAQTPGSVNNGFLNLTMIPNGTGPPVMSLTDISLEQAMEKVQELATENTTLREYLKENNENMKRQFNMLLQWKEKVRDSNQQNLHRFEQLRAQISVLRAENEKYKLCLQDPGQKGAVMDDLQKHIRKLETEKLATRQEMSTLQEKMETLKLQASPTSETVYMNSRANDGELDAVRRRCEELSQQVAIFHQQNEQLMTDLQQINALKLEVQTENSKLHEDNLDLQKKIESFLGDMNKTKYSMGALKDPNNKHDYSGQQVSSTGGGGAGEQETCESSVTSKTDLEILQMQTAVSERQASQERGPGAEAVLSGREEELKVKLQSEKERSSQQSQKLSQQVAQISRLQSQLAEKEQMLAHYKEQLDSQKAHMTEEHRKHTEGLMRQLDNINSELKHTKSSMPYTEDVQNLKSQVMFLIKESQELTARLEMATKTIDKKSSKIMELEEHVRSGDQSRQEMNNYIQTMNHKVRMSEDTINKERSEHATTKKQLMEFRSSFNRLVNDYKELLDTFDEYKVSQTQQQTGNQTKQQMEEINRLTAQTIAAEEAITYRDDQIKQLKEANIKLKDEVENTIPVLRAQAEVWKQDFDAERNARERQVQEKDTILLEMKNLEVKNQQLIDELESYSRKSLAEMQRRHATPTYHQQLHNQLQGGSAGGNYYPMNHSPPANQYPGSPSGGPVTPPRPGQSPSPHRPGYPQQPGYNQQQPVEHANMEDALQPTNNPVQGGSPSRSGSSQDDGDAQNTCPKCGIYCPDLDTIQIHIIDCLD